MGQKSPEQNAAARSVMLHVFCGADRGEWEELSCPRHEVLALDLPHGHDLLDDILYGYLLCGGREGVRSGGRGLVILLGCGVTSSLVFNWCGKGIDRAGRFGKVGIEAFDERLVKREFALLWRFWHLFDVAKTANQCAGRCDPLFLFEHPSDLAHKTHRDSLPPQVPSIWSFPEWRGFSCMHKLSRLSHVQFGNSKLATNSLVDFAGLHGLEVDREDSKSGSWAAPLRVSICRAFKQRQALWDEFCCLDRFPAVKAVGDPKALWRQHVLQDHYPRRRYCFLCQQAIAQSKPHGRCRHPQLGVLSLDLAGPYKTGYDGSKYFRVATFTCP